MSSLNLDFNCSDPIDQLKALREQIRTVGFLAAELYVKRG